jgi:tetratricopeptide (TPR) repeat protein
MNNSFPGTSKRFPTFLAFAIACLLFFAGCAAQQHRDRGLAAMERGDPVAARYYFEQAVDLDPGLRRSKGFQENYRIVRRDAAMVEADAAMQAGDFRTAIERYRLALTAERDYRPALAGIEKARGSAADAAYQRAIAAADQGDLSRAKTQLDQALAYDKIHLDANAAMQSLSRPKTDAPESYRQALAAAERSSWDISLEQLTATVATEPTFLPARAELSTLPARAAADLTYKADAALSRDALDEAQSLYLKALRFNADSNEALSGLSDLYVRQGNRLRNEARPGAALLQYRKAMHLRPSRAASDAAAEVRREILADHAMAIDFQPTPVDNAEASELADLVRSSLSAGSELDSFRIDPQGVPLSIDLQQLEVAPTQVTAETRQHPYPIEVEVPNPDLPYLEAEVDRARDDLERAERRYYSYRPAVSYGVGYGYGYGHYGSYRYSNSGLKFGLYFGDRKKFRCSRHGYGCGGCGYRHGHSGVRVTYSGHYYSRHRHDRLVRAQRDYRRAVERLSSAPRTVLETQTAYHTYTAEIHRQTGRAVAAYRLSTEPQRTVAESYSTSDVVIDANQPEIGLYPDPLNLASPSVVRNELIEGLADKVVIQVRRAAIQSKAKDLREASSGDPNQQLENQVAAAVLIHRIDPDVSQQLLIALDK